MTTGTTSTHEGEHALVLHAARTCLGRLVEHAPKVELSWASAATLMAAAVERLQVEGYVPMCRRCQASLPEAVELVRELYSWPLGVDLRPEWIVRFTYAPRVGGVCSLACWLLADGTACPVRPVDFFDL